MRIVKEHDERRDEILDTAEGLFLSKGYDKTTINDILKAIGIAKGTFYHYFKSKEEVMDAVIMRVIEADMVIARRISADKQVSALERIFRFILSQSSGNNQQKDKILEQFPKVENALMKQRAMEATLKYVCPVLEKIIREGNQNGEFDTPYPLEAIQFLVAGIQTMVDDDSKDAVNGMEHRLQAFIDIIFRVLGVSSDENRKQQFRKGFMQLLSD